MGKMRLTKKRKAAIMLFYFSIISAASNFVSSRRIRRYAVRPVNRARNRLGHFNTLFNFIKCHDEEQFFKYTRMTSAQFNTLLKIVESGLQKNPKRVHLSPVEQLAITLHFLSEGCSMQQLAWDYYVGKTTVHKIVTKTCRVLWEKLSPTYLKPPSTHDFENIAKGFYKRWNMPNCVGAVDGKHIAIQAPHDSGSQFFNYKKHFSIVLMAVCDAYHRFTMVDIGAAGSNHDGYIFKEAGFGSSLLNGNLNVPNENKLPHSEYVLPHFLIADAAFPLHKNIMRPYPGNGLTDERKIFNYRLSRARRIIENTFGILVQRWRILRKPIIANVDNCEAFVQATVVLHNFLQKKEEDIPVSERKYCPTGLVDYVDRNGNYHHGTWRDDESTLKSVGRLRSNNSKLKAKQARDNLAAWLTSDVGSVTWQYEKIYEGSLPTK